MGDSIDRKTDRALNKGDDVERVEKNHKSWQGRIYSSMRRD